MSTDDLAALIADTKTHLHLQLSQVPAASNQRLERAQALSDRWECLSPVLRAAVGDITVESDRYPGLAANFLDELVQDAYRDTTHETRTDWCALVARAIEWGLSPNRFNGWVTPVGMAGYTGQVDLLETFRQAGADLVLRLNPKEGGSDMDGSTLLQRVVLRPVPGTEKVADYLAYHVPESLVPDAAGRCALDDSDVPPQLRVVVRAAVERRLAEHATASV